MSAKITLFDFASNDKLGNSAWNPNVFKARLVLAYKRLPYTTTFIEWPDIQKTLEPHNAIPPTKDDGSPSWTLPAILYESPGEKKVIIDSWEIAKFLDERYPETPKVTELAQGDGKKVELGAAAGIFEQRWIANWSNIFGSMALKVVAISNPASAAFFRRTREAEFGTKLENLAPADGAKDVATWGTFIGGLEAIAAAYARNEGGDWFFGESFTFVDAIPLGFLSCLKVAFGSESEEWKLVENAAGGFWKGQIQKAEKWIQYNGKQ